jgi:hypothetical protein
VPAVERYLLQFATSLLWLTVAPVMVAALWALAARGGRWTLLGQPLLRQRGLRQGKVDAAILALTFAVFAWGTLERAMLSFRLHESDLYHDLPVGPLYAATALLAATASVRFGLRLLAVRQP